MPRATTERGLNIECRGHPCKPTVGSAFNTILIKLRFSRIEATLLVLQAAATGARIVAPCSSGGFAIFGAQTIHEPFHRHARPHQRRDPLQGWSAMDEKLFQTRAKIVKPRFAVGCAGKSVLWTSAIARAQDLALPAVSGDSVALDTSEVALRRVLQYFRERGFEDVPDAMLLVDKMIAGVEISVMLDDDDIAAGLLEQAQSMLHAEQRS